MTKGENEQRLGRIIAIALVGAAFVYTVVIGFLVVFSIGFFGLDDGGRDPLGAVVFIAIALSPLLVWWYCLKRVRAWLRGERPRF